MINCLHLSIGSLPKGRYVRETSFFSRCFFLRLVQKYFLILKFVMLRIYWFTISSILSSYAQEINYTPEWNTRASQSFCLDIPENFSLCYGVRYRKMHLPNLLGHETMFEVSNQAASWVPLLNIACHPDTKTFLCSLFAPVCLERPIFPCRSLCNAVKQGCEKRMQTYGYPWPEMLRCEQYPPDNDMCIRPQTKTNVSSECSACRQPETMENIVDNFCRADIVVKTKVRKLSKQMMFCKKPKILKVNGGTPKRDLKKLTFTHANMTECCGELIKKAGKKSHILVMGVKQDEQLSTTFVMKWKKNQEFKKATKMMKKIDCNYPQMLSETMMTDGMFKAENEKGKRRKRGQRSKKQHIAS